MPTPTKFTAETRGKLLEALQVGASRRTACAVARISDETLRTWLERGKTAEAGSRWAEFREQVEEAEAHPRMRALGVIYREMPDDAKLAWKFIERREPGYAPPMPVAPSPSGGPVVINLTLSDGSLPALGGVIEGEVVPDEPDDTARPNGTEPTALPSA